MSMPEAVGRLIVSVCRICLVNGTFERFEARERMFASGEAFSYLGCPACGSLQIERIPDDLAAYYPPGYYSYRQGASDGPRASLRRLRNRAVLQDRLLGRLQPNEALQAVARLLPPRGARMLDVGCGQGQLVNALHELGYTEVLGIDPFLPADLSARVLSRELSAIDGRWDLIMFHHSLEHLPDPRAAIGLAAERLSPRGRLLIRVPTVDSWARAHYGPHWVQWDAPRHLYLFSRAAMRLLADACGLRLRALWDDSGVLQFWGSERYRRGLPLAGASRLERLNPDWLLRAARLNASGRGDQIVCLLSR